MLTISVKPTVNHGVNFRGYQQLSFKASSSKGEVNTCEVIASHLHECPAQSDVSSSSCFDRKANALKHNYHRHDFIALMSELELGLENK